MGNFNRFEKWYSDYVINHHKSKLKVNIKNSVDLGWKIHIEFDESLFSCSDYFSESKKKSNYNYYKIESEKGVFEAEGDFAKLDFLLGKFLTYISHSVNDSPEKDFFMKPVIQNFIFTNSENDNIFLHYTYEKEIAEKIIKEGFKFCNFDKTTTKIQNDEIVLNYNHIIRKPFGTYVIVICVSKKVYNKYLQLINKSKNKYLKVEEILITKKRFKNDNGEDVSVLHPKFIKGFFDYQKGTVVKNPEFKSDFDSDLFLKNIP